MFKSNQGAHNRNGFVAIAMSVSIMLASLAAWGKTPPGKACDLENASPTYPYRLGLENIRMDHLVDVKIVERDVRVYYFDKRWDPKPWFILLGMDNETPAERMRIKQEIVEARARYAACNEDLTFNTAQAAELPVELGVYGEESGGCTSPSQWLVFERPVKAGRFFKSADYGRCLVLGVQGGGKAFLLDLKCGVFSSSDRGERSMSAIVVPSGRKAFVLREGAGTGQAEIHYRWCR